jgi:hypothetical protein
VIVHDVSLQGESGDLPREAWWTAG